MEKKELRDILPSIGIWTVEDFAHYLGARPAIVMQELSDLGVPIISFSRLYRYKVFHLEDLKKEK